MEEEKRKAALERKKENASLLADEESNLEKSVKTPAKKVTQTELRLRREEEEEAKRSTEQSREETKV